MPAMHWWRETKRKERRKERKVECNVDTMYMIYIASDFLGWRMQ